ncbi:MAG: sporulation protein [Actinomycetota bacterium]|nr:sporulation protein [Actinomycetota bacterium]MDQ5808557.1 sporulation protein [Actinomycetota bacterium]
MGFLDRFTGKRPEITVTAEPAEALPGDEVRVRVLVEGEFDDKVEGARAGIRCLNEYLTKEWDRQDDEWDEVWRAVTMHEDAQDLPLQAGEHEFTFRLPTDLPPDSKHAVSWWAWAQVSRRRGLDAKGSARIAVRLPAPPGADERRSVPAHDGVAFDDLPAAVRAGGTLDGTLSVTPEDDVKATGLKVMLTRVVDYQDDRHKIQRKEKVAEVEIAGARDLARGQTEQHPFSVPLPPNPGPTAQAPHSVVTWVVTGAVARRMKFDLEVEAPVVVYDAPA